MSNLNQLLNEWNQLSTTTSEVRQHFSEGNHRESNRAERKRTWRQSRGSGLSYSANKGKANNFYSRKRKNFTRVDCEPSSKRRKTTTTNFDYRNNNNKKNRNLGQKRNSSDFKYLQTLSRKDSEELILELSKNEQRILTLIQNNLTDNGTILIVKILTKITQSCFEESKHEVLQTYLNDLFLKHVVNYILHLTVQGKEDQKKNQYFWNNPEEFWKCLLEICEEISNSTLSNRQHIVSKIVNSLMTCFPALENQKKLLITEEIKTKLQELNTAIENKTNENTSLTEQNNTQPEDFRQLSVYPTSFELLSVRQNVVSKNVIDGPYKNVDEYLGVQFRLLREDFIRPLRTAIEAIRSEANLTKIRKIDNITLYNKVQFLNPETVNYECCVRLCFDSNRRKRLSLYTNSKKFMYGSLLCFTMDNFDSIIFGKVAERKIEDLEKGELIVAFSKNMFDLVDYKVDYLMIESGIYFEPYFNVLTAMKTISVYNFPMEKYIIRAEPSVKPPQYLSDTTEFKIQYKTFNPLQNWPEEKFYNLNEAQLAAFRSALTQEFCIIQGPPGTGKTFLGLKITKTLIENKNVWYKKTPILVICYTNHALDQFLEGVSEFTQNIIRVGGQSKDQNLDAFNLRKKSYGFEIKKGKEKTQEFFIKIKIATKNLELIESYTGIVNFDVFQNVVPDFRNTWFFLAQTNDILDWLLDTRRNPVVSVTRNSHAQQIKNQTEKNNQEEVEKKVETHNNEHSLSDEDDEDIFKEVRISELKYDIPALTVDILKSRIESLKNEARSLKHDRKWIELRNVQHDLQNLRKFYIYLTDNLAKGKQHADIKKRAPASIDLKQPFTIQPHDRWNLYFYWLDLYKNQLKQQISFFNKQFRETHQIYTQMRIIHNTNVMKDALIVGMTTTGAARLRLSLQALKNPIVIVEEAAEVLEAHIIAALTSHCRHLILIGDHKQLRPSTADYEIGIKFNLEVSLFERMVMNKIQLHTLNVQHRMKPEISKLISPVIYPTLEDHASVKARPRIKGVDKCVFFIDHIKEEARCEGTSKKNSHEVDFLIEFAKHLILNGYEPESITILAAYLGQKYEMQKERTKHEDFLKNVRIEVLDNYQGEESDIILLSLVRNNQENRIGFLSVENRVCVALSRARNGLYIMGNINQLSSASELWQKVRGTLEQQNAVGTELPLRCQVHQDKVTFVKTGKNIAKLKHGGCNQKCATTLKCGHICPEYCHILDRNHESKYKCREKCARTCDVNPEHFCLKKCYEQCGSCTYLVQKQLACGHVAALECHKNPESYSCRVLVPTKLSCGHEVDKPCHQDPQTFSCPFPCKIKVEPCGHACKLLCHFHKDPDHLEYQCRKKCARHQKGCTTKTQEHLCPKLCYEECEPCNIEVLKQRSDCGHSDIVFCSHDVNKSPCENPCSKLLPCGHQCRNKCKETCGTCQVKIGKVIPICGHKITTKCCEEPDRKLCNRRCPLKLPCGHNCTKKCHEPCTSVCKKIVTCSLKSPCGHQITSTECWIVTSKSERENAKILLNYCTQSCSQLLKCGHPCSGTCRECHQGRIHKRCSEKCGFPLICTHPCNFPCRQACQPCKRKCPYNCIHSVCSKECGDVCTPCKEKCTRVCIHQRCNRFCGEICDVPPCEKPCKQFLKCGHLCVGFCGEPCPPKCLICDKEELTKIFFGTEEDEGARFVILKDCGHVFESVGLQGWLQQDEGAIRIKVCPQCKTPIYTTQRYSDITKNAMKDIANVKRQVYGYSNDNISKRIQLIAKVNFLKHIHINVDFKLNAFLKTLEQRLQPSINKKKQPINKAELSNIETKLQILEFIINICKDVFLDSSTDSIISQVNLISTVADREDSITEQEVEDLQFELHRLSRIVEYNKLKHSVPTKYLNHECNNLIKQIETVLFGFEKFQDETEETVKTLLKDLSKLTSGIGISEKEIREIVRVMGFK